MFVQTEMKNTLKKSVIPVLIMLIKITQNNKTAHKMSHSSASKLVTQDVSGSMTPIGMIIVFYVSNFNF